MSMVDGELDGLQLQSPSGMQKRLADRLRAARVLAGLKQSTLATRAGVSLGSLRLFEQRGEISLKHLMRICHALGRLDELEGLFLPPPAATLAELEARLEQPARRRGSR
jgi:transcriptional regulator with XRE-family HTH domain